MVPTLEPKIDLERLYVQLVFTLIRLQANPHTQAYVAEFEELETEWWTVAKLNKALLREELATELAIDLNDQALASLSDEIVSLILIDTKGDRTAALFVRYYGSKRPSAFKRQRLEEKFDEMKKWSPSLIASSNPALKACGTRLAQVIKETEDATLAIIASNQKVADFRLTGPGKQFVDKCNARRKATYGKLAQMVHEQPALLLPRDFADSFFMHESAARPPSMAEIDKKIASAEGEVARLKAQRDARVNEELAEAAAKEVAEKKLRKAKLEAAAKDAAEAAARLAELQRELGEEE